MREGQPFAPGVRFPFIRIPLGLARDPELSNGAKLLWGVLADHARDQSTCWPSLERLGFGIGRSRAQVKRYVRELTAAGLVEISVRKPGTNLWTLVYRERLELAGNGRHSPFPRPPARQEQVASELLNGSQVSR